MSAARAEPRSILSRPDVNYAACVLNAAVILAFWWFSSGFEITRGVADALNGLGRVTGLLGTYFVLWQLLLMARLPTLEDAFGLERMAVLHKWNGYLSVGLLVAHAIFQTAGYQLANGHDLLTQLSDFSNSYPGLLAAIVGLVLLVAVVVASVTIARRRLAYETWYFIHLYTYLAIVLAFSHQLLTGVDFAGNPVFVWYWCLLFLAVGAQLLLYRVVGPLFAYQRHRFHVQSIQKEAVGVFSIYIGGRDLKEFEVQGGQFAFWRFLDGKRWWQAHPFSVSALPDGRRLRITVKNIGDFTSGIHELKPGTPVLVEGPFGKFTEPPVSAGGKVLLIAGGIGITPIRPLAEEMALAGFDVRVLYRASREADLALKGELQALTAEHGVQVDYLLSEPGRRPPRGTSWFDPDMLMRLVPDIAGRVVYVCGPAGMRRAVLAALEELGVPQDHIHTEVFRLQ